MAHDLAMTNGQTAMAYYGELPWHGLGTRLQKPATAAEAILAAGLDYQVELSPIMTTGGLSVPQRQAVVRSDNDQVLGVVGNTYTPIQNAECFSFLDAVVANGQLRYHTAGALGQGERIWLLAKLPGHVRIKNSDDITEKFLLLSNSHNGTSALRCFFTPIRVVCANTLTIANRQARQQGVSIRHKGDLKSQIKSAQHVLGLAAKFYDSVQTKANLLASHYPSRKQIDTYFKTLYPDPPTGNKKRSQNIRNRLVHLFESGIGQDIPQVRHTTWAALNAVTEYVDHHRPSRAPTLSQRSQNRLVSAWFGSGARLKSKAWDLALDLASE